MKRVVLVLLLLLVSYSTTAFAQQTAKAKEGEKEPATKFEAFLARKGALIIKDFYDIGTISGLGRANLIAVVLYSPGESNKVYALRFEKPATRQYASDQTGVMDFDELVSLGDALDYMIKKADELKKETREYTEVEFSTRAGLKVGFYQKGTKQGAFLRVNRWSSDAAVFLEVSQLSELKNLVSKAAEKLRTHGAE